MKHKLLDEIAKLRFLVEQQTHDVQILKSAILGSPNIIYWKNKDSIYLGESNACSAFRKKCGSMKDSSVGCSDEDVFATSKNAGQYRENDLKVLCSREPLVVEEVVICPNADDMHLLSMKSPIYDDGRL
jgi:hypothetical protein